MGTRADFYSGRGKTAEWLGSIAWDGTEIPDEILYAHDDAMYRLELQRLATKLARRAKVCLQL